MAVMMTCTAVYAAVRRTNWMHSRARHCVANAGAAWPDRAGGAIGPWSQSRMKASAS